MLQFDALGCLGLAAAAVCWGFALVLYRLRSSGEAVRLLALLLFIEGLALVSTGFLDMVLTAPVRAGPGYAAWLRGEEVLHTFADCATLALYPAFLAVALQTPLVRRFAHSSIRIAVALVSTALFFATLWSPLQVGAMLLYVMLSLMFGFAFVVSIHAWRSAEAGAARVRAGSFALAFGLRDACWGVVYGVSIREIFAHAYAITETDAADATTLVQFILYAGGSLLYVPLVAYGILRSHLFDIDLRIKWTIRQSTVASAFVGIFYLVSEGAARFLSSELGNIAGLLAAAVVMFFLAPLQRFGERVASLAMPNTNDTPEYASFRKMQVYEEAVAESRAEGGVSAKERALLRRLRDSLGISAVDAEAIERHVEARLAGAA